MTAEVLCLCTPRGKCRKHACWKCAGEGEGPLCDLHALEEARESHPSRCSHEYELIQACKFCGDAILWGTGD